jgi:hypothetical protein
MQTCKALAKADMMLKLRIHRLLMMPRRIPEEKNLKYVNTVEEVFEGADVVVLLQIGLSFKILIMKIFLNLCPQRIL